MALALSLRREVPHRAELLTMAFGVVAFSIIVQGLTVRPLLRFLDIETAREGDYDVAKVRSAYLASRRELEFRVRHLISQFVYSKLSRELDAQVKKTQDAIAVMQQENGNIVSYELRLARARLIAAEKSSIQQSANQGLISMHVAESLLAEADQELDRQISERETAT